MKDRFMQAVGTGLAASGGWLFTYGSLMTRGHNESGFPVALAGLAILLIGVDAVWSHR